MSHQKLSEELRILLQTDAEALTVAQLVDRVGDRGFGLLLHVLSLPSALPDPAAGYSVPFGILLVVLAVQMLVGKAHPVFPKRLQRVTLSKSLAEKLLNGASWIFEKLEWIVRPRMKWVGQRIGLTLMGVLVMIMAILMMIPIPLTNSFPAMVIFLIGVGLTEEDGVFAILACFVGVFAVLLYGGLIWAMILYVPEVAETIKESIRSFLG